jgi:hypothetical protein
VCSGRILSQGAAKVNGEAEGFRPVHKEGRQCSVGMDWRSSHVVLSYDAIPAVQDNCHVSGRHVPHMTKLPIIMSENLDVSLDHDDQHGSRRLTVQTHLGGILTLPTRLTPSRLTSPFFCRNDKMPDDELESYVPDIRVSSSVKNGWQASRVIDPVGI